MNNEINLLKLLLNHSFVAGNKHRLSKSMLDHNLAPLWDTVMAAHERYARDLTTEEVRELVKAEHPMMTKAAFNNLCAVLETVSDAPDFGADVAQDVLKATLRAELGRKLGEVGIEVMEGRKGTPQALQEIEDLRLQLANDCASGNLIELPEDDVLSAFDNSEDRYRWKFNIPSLAQVVPGISPGMFLWAMARPNAGKTAFWITLACAPGGFCDQGAKVLAVMNEEARVRNFRRAVSAYTGMTQDQIYTNPLQAAKQFEPIRGRIKMVDQEHLRMHVDAIDELMAQVKPDIVVLDQLDKVECSGKFDRQDQKLTAVYWQARELAKKHKAVAIGICQASASAQGKTVLDGSQAADSRTGKMGEADIAFGIGMRELDTPDAVDDGMRFVRLVKNKVSGVHCTIPMKLNVQLSRYVE